MSAGAAKKTAPWLIPLALAVALRVWQIDLTPFLDDEAVLLTAAARMIDTHRLALDAGLALSIHVNEPPLVLYLACIPMLISRNPAWVAGCLALVDASATVLIYRAALRVSGRFAGFAAAMLFAAAPAAVYFSRRIYYSELVPFCCAVFILACIRALQKPSARDLAVAFVAAVCAAEFHASAAILLPAWIAVAAFTWRALPSHRGLAVGAGLALLTIAPYLYLQTRNGWADAAGVATFLREPKTLDAGALEQAVRVIGGGIYRQLQLPFLQPPPAFSLDPVGWLLIGLVLAGAGLALASRGPSRLLLVALLVLPVLASLRHAEGVLPYYLLPALPPATILAGVALAAVPWRLAGLVLAAIPVVWQVAGYANLLRVAAADGPSLSYGMPLRYEIAAARLVAGLPAGERLLVSEVGNQATTFPYLTGHRLRIVESDSRYGLSFPAPNGSPAYELVQGGGHAYDFLAQHFGPPLGAVLTTSGQPAFGLFRTPTDAVASIERDLTPVRASVADAIEPRGYSAPEIAAGQPSPLLLEWRITNPGGALPSEVQQFAHLVDQADTTWSTDADERAYPRMHWAAGDTVLTWFDLAPKPSASTGGYWIETGFYGYTTNQPLPVSTGSGPPSASLRIGPVRLSGVEPPTPSSAPLATFGTGEIELLAAQRTGSKVTLTWRATRQPSADYTVFVHLLDARGQLIAQHDGDPRDGSFPTTLWRPGDVIIDVHDLGASASAGGVRLEVGLYTKPDLRRLPTSPGSDHVDVPA